MAERVLPFSAEAARLAGEGEAARAEPEEAARLAGEGEQQGRAWGSLLEPSHENLASLAPLGVLLYLGLLRPSLQGNYPGTVPSPANSSLAASL